ncbi:MAG TPA: SIMPL domain-containing protein [Candidatus Limnocylindria bacterium]
MGEKRWISVTAEGEATVAPDLAVVSFAVSGDGKELGATRDDVNRRSSAVLAKLRELEIADADINAPDVGIYPQYDYRKGQKLIGYRVVRQMTTRVRSLDRLGDVLDGLVGAGANEVGGAEMATSDPSAAEHEALTRAMAAARAKADAIAAAAGVAIGAVARVEEEAGGGAGPLPKFAARGAMVEMADAATEVATGDLTVTRRIRAWFAIE